MLLLLSSLLVPPCRPHETYQFAYTYPYTYTQLQRFLAGLPRRCPGVAWRRHLLGRSVQGRRHDLLTVADPAPIGGGLVRRT